MSYEPKLGIDYAYESDCPAWKCPHISVHDWREGRRCLEHPCTCPDPTEFGELVTYEQMTRSGDPS